MARHTAAAASSRFLDQATHTACGGSALTGTQTRVTHMIAKLPLAR